MKKIFLGIVLLIVVVAIFAGCAANENNSYRVYVPNAGEGTVSVYDTVSQKTLQTIKVGETASHGIAVTPDNKYLYSGDLDGGNIYVIDTKSGKKIKTVEVGERTHGIDISPDGKYVLVAAGRSGGPILAVIDTKTNEIIATLTAGMQGPTHMSFAPDGKRAYVADPVANAVVVVDMVNLNVEAVWDSGSDGPQETRPSPDGKYLYVANYEGGTLAVLDTASGKVLKTIPTGEKTHAVAVSPDGKYIWVVVQQKGQVRIFDAEDNYALLKIIDTLPSPNHLNFTPDGKQVFVTDTKENKVAIFDAESYQKLQDFAVGVSPHEIDFVNTSKL